MWADIIAWPTLDNFIPTQTIIKTVNGGASWTSSTFSDDPTETPNSIFAFDEQTAYISSVNGDYVSSVYRTRNGGTTWEKLNVEHPAGYFNSLYFWDRMNGIVFGDPDFDAEGHGKYLIYTTRDGGDTWVRSDNAPAAILSIVREIDLPTTFIFPTQYSPFATKSTLAVSKHNLKEH